MPEPAVSRAGLPFVEQIAFFRAKLGNLIPTERWTDVWQAQHDRGFMVAGAAKADLLADLAGAVERTIADGRSIDWFRAQFDQIAADHGWSYKGGRNWRTRVIYRTNMTTSYAAGRLAQLRDPELTRVAPYWMYRHNDSVANPRPLHQSWDGLALPADHPWFRSHYPPNGWGCHCYVVAVTEGQARRRGRLAEDPPDDGLQSDGTPAGLDRGWDYMPGDTVTDDIRRALGAKAATLPGPLGPALTAEAARIPPAPPATGLPAYRAARTVKEAERMAQEILDAPGGVAYATGPDGLPIVRFGHGRTAGNAVRQSIYGKAKYAGLDIETANTLNQELRVMQAECDRLGIPRLRAVKTGAGRAAASMGDGVLSVSKNLTVRQPRVAPAVSSARAGDALRDKPHTTMSYFADPTDAFRSTLWHEFAHHVHQQLGVSTAAEYLRPRFEARLVEFVRAVKGDLIIPSRYAATNAKEFFAESFALYKLGRSDIIDPRLVALIRDIEDGTAL